MHAAVFEEDVRPALVEEGIVIVRWDELAEDEQVALHGFFRESVFPVLTPLAVDPAHPFPYISGLSLNLAVVLLNPKTGNEHFARVKVPPLLPRFIRVSDQAADSPLADLYNTRFVPLEDIIAAHLDQLFPGMEVLEHFTFRVTRNEDLEVEEDDAENLLTALEKELIRRRFGPPVRLEVAEDIDDHVLDLLVRELGVHDSEVYRLPAPLDLTGLNLVADLDRTELHFPTFVPKTHPDLSAVESSQPSDIFAVDAGQGRPAAPPVRLVLDVGAGASSSRPRPTPRSSPSSRPSTAPAATAPSSTRSSTPPRPASRCSRSSRSRPGSTSRPTSAGPASWSRPASTSSTASSA